MNGKRDSDKSRDKRGEAESSEMVLFFVLKASGKIQNNERRLERNVCYTYYERIGIMNGN